MTAQEYEDKLAAQAEQLRGDSDVLTPALFRQLWPLLCEPIHAEHIVTAPPVQGKPYESTGIRSVQVQVDRMNNVLTPLWWWDHAEYAQNGRLCTVTVYVGSEGTVLAERTSAGGVERGSTTGNLYKGSYTNAAKVAFARLGVGHEVYLGLLDLEPDVGGEEPGPAAPVEGEIGEEVAAGLWKRADDLGFTDRLQQAAAYVVERNIDDCSTEEAAAIALRGLTFKQAERLDNWLSKKADAAAGEAEES